MLAIATSRFVIAGAVLFCVLASGGASEAKRLKCKNEECDLKPEHFDLYSTIKRAVEADFYMKGKDIIPLIRSVQVLRRRFVDQPSEQQLNGTKTIVDLLQGDKLARALEVFESDEGRNLINLYKTSINGNQQNLACSEWRVNELQLAAKKLEREPKLAQIFANIHKNFAERSARKCLKSACSSIDDNMNHLNSIQRHASRRKGFVAREDVTGKLYEESSLSTNSLDELLVAQLDSEPAREFQREELELCQFFKRTNQSSCQASGNELAEISFLKPVQVNNETVQSKLEDFLSDYTSSKEFSSSSSASSKPLNASATLLNQCASLKPLLSYHISGLQWYQRSELITSHKLQARTFWCPSLSYWLEIDRLCNELETQLNSGGVAGTSGAKDDKKVEGRGETFAY